MYAALRDTTPVKPHSVEIAAVSLRSFTRIVQEEDTELFVTSLAEVEAIIAQKHQILVGSLDAVEAQTLRSRVPPEYHEFLDVFSKRESDSLPPSRGPRDHKIQLESDLQLGYCPLYKMTLEELEAAKGYIEENLEKGFIVPSAAPFASPILMAPKPGGGLRFCVDFRKLNSITKKDRYPLPLIGEMLDRLKGAEVFTKIDIRQGFHRIRMHPDSEDLTTFRSRYGTYKYRVMPFGVTNGPAAFQRLINEILHDLLDEIVVCYVDDLLIYSKDKSKHAAHVREVLRRLREAGLQAAIHKCEFGVQETKFLGFIVSQEGIRVDPEKVAAVAHWPRPRTVKEVQGFLGFCNFYRRFIREYGRIANPLHRLTKKNYPFGWLEACELAFSKLKQALIEAPILSHYDPHAETRVETDAADGVVGGVLSQKKEDSFWHPVAFFSKTMEPAERNYEIHDKEMLAIIRALQEWRAELQGLRRETPFDILTDHRSLEYFMSTKKLSPRQARWAEMLSQYRFLIRFRPGKKNCLADPLTRKEAQPDTRTDRTQILLPQKYLEAGVSPEDPASYTGSYPKPPLIAPLDPELTITDRVLRSNRTHETLQRWRDNSGPNWTMQNGLLLYQGRLVVPDEEDLRARLLDEIHRQPSTAHPGRTKTEELVRARYWWPGWRGDIRRYLDNCLICKRTHTWHDLPPGLLNPLPIPTRPWQHISMDFRSFPKDKKGFDAALVIVDRLGKRPISIPCQKTITAQGTARLFVDQVYRWVGLPDTIVSDRGPQFVSEFWGEFCRILGIQRKLSTAHHPQTDGQTEIVNQHVAQRLRPLIDYYQDDWSDYLPIIDFAAATLLQESIGMSPFVAERGYEPRMSFDWTPATEPPTSVEAEKARQQAHEWVSRIQGVWELAREHMQRAQDRQKAQADRHRRDEVFEVGDTVMVTTKDWNLHRPNRKLADQAAGPFRIIEKVGNSYRLDLPPHIKVHPVFAPEKLRRAARLEPLRGQISDPPTPMKVNDEDEWEVERILAVRLHYRKLQYRVKWIGHDEPDSQWYAARNLKNSPQLLSDFHAANPTRPGPPKRLSSWLTSAENDDFEPDHIDDDQPA
jgi:transposase InsO family protein